MTPDPTLAELERLLEAATPLPWSNAVLTQAGNWLSGGPPAIFGARTETDAALIVAAVNALPRLLAERKALRSALEDAGEQLATVAVSMGEHGWSANDIALHESVCATGEKITAALTNKDTDNV